MSVIGNVFELKSPEFGDFNNEINGFDNSFELESGLEYGALPSLVINETIGKIQDTPAPAFNFLQTGVGLSETGINGCDLIPVSPIIRTATTQIDKNENKNEWSHSQAEAYQTASIIDRIFNFDPIAAIAAKLRDFDDRVEHQVWKKLVQQVNIGAATRVRVLHVNLEDTMVLLKSYVFICAELFFIV